MSFQDLYKGKRVLITGHTGFKGSWLSEWLLSLGAKVGGYALDPYTDPSLFDVLKLKENLDFHRIADIRNFSSVMDAVTEFKPEIVFHLAAQPLVRESYDFPKETFDTNVGGTVNILEAIRRTDSVKSAVIVTTDKVYENNEKVDGYSETDPLGGEDPYSASKAASEVVAQSYIRSFFMKPPMKVQVATARAGNVFGGGDWSKDRIVADCAKAWMEEKPVIIRNPSAVRPWQHVLDCLSGYLWLGVQLWNANQEAVGESFNFGPLLDSNRNVLSLVEEFKKTWPHVQWQLSETKEKVKKETNLLWLKTDKAQEKLKWKSTLDFEGAVSFTSRWYQSFNLQQNMALEFTRSQIQSYEQKARDHQILWAL